MEKEEVLEKAQSKRDVVGEMERGRLGKSAMISLLCAGVVAVVMIIIEGSLRHISAIFAISAVCYVWASVFYFCQYFLAKRPWPVLIGAVLHGLAACTMLALYVLYNVGVL